MDSSVNPQIGSQPVKINFHLSLELPVRVRLGKERSQLGTSLKTDFLFLAGDDKKRGSPQFFFRQRKILKGFASESFNVFILNARQGENGNSVGGLGFHPSQALCQIVDTRRRHHLGEVIDGNFSRGYFQGACSGGY